MYEKDKHQRITLRLNEEQFAFVKASADDVGVTPSEFLRMVVTMTMRMSPKIEKAVKIEIDEKALTDDENETKKGMVTGRENDEASRNNQLQQ